MEKEVLKANVDACLYILDRCAGGWATIDIKQVSYKKKVVSIEQKHIDFMLKEGLLEQSGIFYQLTRKGREFYVGELKEL